jgi:transposase
MIIRTNESLGSCRPYAILRFDHTIIMENYVMTDKRFIGFDVSKDDIAVAYHGSRRAIRIANHREAILAWLAEQDLDQIELAVFEPTGGYERTLKQALIEMGVAFAQVHPNEVAAYRTRRAIKAKTDDLDAILLAGFAAEELSHRGLLPMVEGNETLRQLAVRRRQLAAMRQAEKCRLAMAETPAVADSISRLIENLEEHIETIDEELEVIIAADGKLSDMAVNLKSLKGIGQISVHTLLAELPELGRFDNKQIASLVGLAPKTRKSGKAVFKARIGYGRPGVRQVLFNAARCAIRHNTIMREFFERLVTINKRPGKVALTAVMHKMLVVLNAIARDGKPWKHKTT